MTATETSLAGLTAALKYGRVSSRELTAATLEKIRRQSPLNNYITVCDDIATDAAARADAMLEKGTGGVLCGVPVAVKDNIKTAGVRTTCATSCLKSYVPDRDAAIVEKLKSLGAVIVGKTNMDELAMGSTNESSAFGAVKNALDLTRVPGGSSGGSANTVAADEVLLALGSDTGGSVRQPAAFCGVVGFKPCAKAVDRSGLIGLSPSLDRTGFILRNATDTKLVFEALAEESYIARAFDDRDVHNKKLIAGVPRGIDRVRSLQSGVYSAFETAVKIIEKLGAKTVTVGLPDFARTLEAYRVISSVEAARSLKSGGRDIPEQLLCGGGFGAEVVRRISRGNAVSAEEYADAVHMREQIAAAYNAALCDCDIILTPSTPRTAVKLGAPSAGEFDIYAAGASLADLPALGIPCGTSDGLPVGLQLITGEYRDGLLFSVAEKFERVYLA